MHCQDSHPAAFYERPACGEKRSNTIEFARKTFDQLKDVDATEFIKNRALQCHRSRPSPSRTRYFQKNPQMIHLEFSDCLNFTTKSFSICKHTATGIIAKVGCSRFKLTCHAFWKSPCYVHSALDYSEWWIELSIENQARSKSEDENQGRIWNRVERFRERILDQ